MRVASEIDLTAEEREANYATHKLPKVKEWLEKHPRFTLHFTPTSASWLNRVECFFRDITNGRLRCGVFKSVPEQCRHQGIHRHA